MDELSVAVLVHACKGFAQEQSARTVCDHQQTGRRSQPARLVAATADKPHAGTRGRKAAASLEEEDDTGSAEEVEELKP